MTKTQIEKTIREAWTHLVRACGRDGDTDSMLDKALETSTRVEKGHRKFMRSLPGGYVVGVDMAAKLFVLRHVYDGCSVPKSWSDVVDIRDDLPLAYALHEILKRRNDAHGKPLFTHAFPDTAFLAIDYAKDIAR